MKGSLSDLKRKLIVGQGVAMTFNSFAGKNNRIGITRYVIKTQSNGIYLNTDKEAKTGSFLFFPKASLFEMTEKGFKIFQIGRREMTPDERKVWDNQPDERDIMTDTDVMWRRRKQYFKESGMQWLGGGSAAIQGKRLVHINPLILPWIKDDDIKGILHLEYEWR